MKIIYEPNQEVFLVEIEYPETETWINTSDIVEVREEFVNRMAWLFDNAVREKFRDNQKFCDFRSKKEN